MDYENIRAAAEEALSRELPLDDIVSGPLVEDHRITFGTRGGHAVYVELPDLHAYCVRPGLFERLYLHTLHLSS